MSSTAFNWLSRLLIVLGIALAWCTKSMIGTPGAIALALGMVCGLWLILLAYYSGKNPTGQIAAGKDAAFSFVSVWFLVMCLGIVALFWAGPPIVHGFFRALSVIDGSHGASDPSTPAPDFWATYGGTRTAPPPHKDVHWTPVPASTDTTPKKHSWFSTSIAPKGK